MLTPAYKPYCISLSTISWNPGKAAVDVCSQHFWALSRGPTPALRLKTHADEVDKTQSRAITCIMSGVFMTAVFPMNVPLCLTPAARPSE